MADRCLSTVELPPHRTRATAKEMGSGHCHENVERVFLDFSAEIDLRSVLVSIE